MKVSIIKNHTASTPKEGRYNVSFADTSLPKLTAVSLSDLSELGRIATEFAKNELRKDHAMAVFALLANFDFTVTVIGGVITAQNQEWNALFEPIDGETPEQTARNILLTRLEDRVKGMAVNHEDSH